MRLVFMFLLVWQAFASSPFVRIETMPPREFTPRNMLVQMDTLWIGSEGNGLFWVDLNTLQYGSITERQFIPFGNIMSMSLGKDGDLWVANALSYWVNYPNAYALSRKTAKGWSRNALTTTIPSRTILVLEHSSGTRFYETFDSIFREDPNGNLTRFPRLGSPAFGPRYHMVGQDTAFWVGDQVSGLCRYDRKATCYRTDFPDVEPKAVSGGGDRPLIALTLLSSLKQYNISTDRFDSIFDFDQRNQMFVDYKARIWTANYQGLFRWEQGKDSCILATPHQQWLFAEDAQKRLWVLGDSTLYRIAGDSLNTVIRFQFPRPSTFSWNGVQLDSLGIPWYGNSYYTGKEWKEDTRFQNGAWFSREGKHFDMAKTTTSCKGSRSFDGTRFTPMEGAVCAMAQLGNGSLIGVANDYDLCRWDGNTWQLQSSDSTDDGILRDHFSQMVPMPDGSLLAGDFSNGSRIRSITADGKLQILSLFPGHSSNSASLDSTGIFWFAQKDSLFRTDGNNLWSIPVPYPAWASQVENGGVYIRDLFTHSSGHLLLSSNVGVFMRDPAGAWTYWDISDGLCSYGGHFYDAGHGEVMLSSGACITRFATAAGDSFYAQLKLPANYPFAEPVPNTLREILPHKAQASSGATAHWWDLLGRQQEKK